MTDHATDSAPAWQAPQRLSPPPANMGGSFPIVPILLAIAVTLGCSAALFGVSQFIYVWILTNTLIGAAIGWALSKAPLNNGYTNLPVLGGIALALSVVPYIANPVINFFQLLLFSDPNTGAQAAEIGLVGFLQLTFESRSVFGFEGGLIVNALIFLAEVGLTVYVAFGKIQDSIRFAGAKGVPSDVFRFVAEALQQGFDTQTIRDRLAGYGWNDHDDQSKAINAVISAIDAQNAG